MLYCVFHHALYPHYYEDIEERYRNEAFKFFI